MRQRSVVIIHTVFWLFWLMFFFLISPAGNKALLIFGYGLFNIGIFYLSYCWVSKILFSQRNYRKGGLRITLLFIFAVAVKFAVAIAFKEEVMVYGPDPEERYTALQYILSAGIVTGFFIMLSFGLRLANNSYQQEQTRKSLENEKLQAELAFFKSRINPHFLFNTLNNIYSLAYKKSDKTAEAVLKLSDIMRYMLQKNPDNKVSLCDEINYLKNYIDLQQLRFENKLVIKFKTEVGNGAYRLTPLLLISFVENAFKHGVTTDPNHPVQILINMEQDVLHFKISNLKNKQNKDHSSGIGLANLQRILELEYPDKHTFNLKNGEFYYTGELFIHLEKTAQND